MDQNPVEQQEVSAEVLGSLREEHRQLDLRIQEFLDAPYMSPEDQIEVARLKKLKLHKKDEVFRIATLLGVEV